MEKTYYVTVKMVDRSGRLNVGDAVVDVQIAIDKDSALFALGWTGIKTYQSKSAKLEAIIKDLKDELSRLKYPDTTGGQNP